MFDHRVLALHFVPGNVRINAVLYMCRTGTLGTHLHAVVMGEKLADSFRLM